MGAGRIVNQREAAEPGDVKSIRREILRLEREHRRAIEAIAELQGHRTFASVDPTHVERVRAGEDASRHALTRDRAAGQVLALLAQLTAMRPAGARAAASWSLPAPDTNSRWARCAPASATGIRMNHARLLSSSVATAVHCPPTPFPLQGAVPVIESFAFMPRPGAHGGTLPSGHHTTEKSWTTST